MYCSKCGKEIEDNSVFCRYCGNRMSSPQSEFSNETDYPVTPSQPVQINSRINDNQAMYQQEIIKNIQNINDSVKYHKSSSKAGLLAIFFLGLIGVHEFYIGNKGLGFLCIITTIITLSLGTGFAPLLLFFVIECIAIIIRGVYFFTRSDEELTQHYIEKQQK